MWCSEQVQNGTCSTVQVWCEKLVKSLLSSFCDWLTDRQTDRQSPTTQGKPTCFLCLPEVQYKGRQIFVTGKLLLEENHLAWIHQFCQTRILLYNAERGAGLRRSWLLENFAKLLTNLKMLPELGFPKLSGFSSMPNHLYSSANLLATDFTGLVVSFMAEVAWDFSFWSDQWPHCFAGLLDKPTAARQILSEIKEQWKCISLLEGLLMPNTPNTAQTVEHQLVESSQTYPELVTCSA